MTDEIIDSCRSELERVSRIIEEHSKYAESLRSVIATREKFLADVNSSLPWKRAADGATEAATEQKEPLGRAQFVLKIIADAKPPGVWPKQIRNVAIQQGMKDLPKNFPSTNLWKLKEAGRIIEGPNGYILKEEEKMEF